MWACRIYEESGKRLLKWTSVDESQRNGREGHFKLILTVPTFFVNKGVKYYSSIELVSCGSPQNTIFGSGGTLYIPGNKKDYDQRAVEFPDNEYTKQLITAMRVAGISVSGYNSHKITINTRKSY